MKYMGSKRLMLMNGLGDLIVQQAKNANRFVDPFCGSGSVVWFAAQKLTNEIVAGDLQKYSVDLSNAVLLNSSESDATKETEKWLINAKASYEAMKKPVLAYRSNYSFVRAARSYCSGVRKANLVITKAYGGYYFGIDQSLKFDILNELIPPKEPYRSICKAAMIMAATTCAAAPGHTAQPFQPTRSAIRFIMESWNRDPFVYVKKGLDEINAIKRLGSGYARVADASKLCNLLQEGDLVFLDPPYSGVHYSRFYHVLETLSNGYAGSVSGTGRYPAESLRPRSLFSLKTESEMALEKLLKKISDKHASAVVTFPVGVCSNGLSGEIVRSTSSKYFRVKKSIIKSRFSTLGGNLINRPARLSSEELVLVLSPK